MTDPEHQHDALQLALLFKSDKHPDGRDAILRAFERTLGDYITALLSPDLDDAQALQTRAKAMGIVETLTSIGLDIAHVMEKAPIQRPIRERVRQSMGIY